MRDKQILDIFYNKIVLEAQKGIIDCYLAVNMPFNLVVHNQEISKCEELPYEGLLIPTLKITNKQLFDDLLVEYVNKARYFYSDEDFSFLNDLEASPFENIDILKEEYITKYIIGNLFANATFSDFDNPTAFLQSRISMFDNKILKEEEELCLGHLDSIGAKMYVMEEKSSIWNETPYRLKSYLEFDDGHILSMPQVYVGKGKDKYYLYAIQGTDQNNELDEKPYLRQIRQGLIAKLKGAPENYFLAFMLTLSLCSDEEIEMVPFCVERWNAKKIANYNRAKVNPNLILLDLDNEQDRIQNNITDIFIRYFTKIEDISDGIDLSVIPFESNSNLGVKINSDFKSRCTVFNELFNLVNEYKDQKDLGRKR